MGRETPGKRLLRNSLRRQMRILRFLFWELERRSGKLNSQRKKNLKSWSVRSSPIDQRQRASRSKECPGIRQQELPEFPSNSETAVYYADVPNLLSLCKSCQFERSGGPRSLHNVLVSVKDVCLRINCLVCGSILYSTMPLISQGTYTLSL